MFNLESDIKIDKYSGIKPNEVKWNSSLSNFCDTMTISLPLATYLKNIDATTEVKDVVYMNDNSVSEVQEAIFKQGMKVSVSLGYNGRLNKVFTGFIARVNCGTPLQLECEGYFYQLKNKYFTKSYERTTAKQILQDLIKGTDIKLSPKIDDIPLTNVWFKNTPSIKVLEWFQKECACKVFFDFDTLYVGASQYAIVKPEQKLRIGWNVIEDKELKKNVSEDVQINIVEKSSSGEVKKTKSEQRKYSSTKEVKVRSGLPSQLLAKAVEEMQQDENRKGYNGYLVLFLEPYIEKGYTVEVEDRRFPERSGRYFVEQVEGSFGSGGGRQKVILKNYGGNG